MSDVVCYIDFDGVLHHDAVFRKPGVGVHIDQDIAPGRSLFEWADHLESALEPYPDVRLVLATSWVPMLGYSRTKRYLPPALAARVVGATYHKQMHGRDPDQQAVFASTPRGEQIAADVSRRRPPHWLALDDDADGWPTALLGHLVRCEPAKGLSSSATRQALADMLAAIEQRRRGPAA